MYGRTSAGVIFAVLAITLGLAACTGDGQPDPATSQGGGDPIAFAKCMRANGIANFPDPNTDGGVRVNKNSRIDQDSPQFKAAQEKCRGSLPTGLSKQDEGDNAWTPELKLKYADCMRANGQADFPDPNKEGQWPDMSKIDLNSAPFKQADAACAKFKPQQQPSSGSSK